MEKKRYALIDSIRGIAVVNMVLYHLLYDIRSIYNIPLPWYPERIGYLWQQSICWTFIFISGMAWSLGRRNLRKGLMVLACGLAISLVTTVFLPAEAVRFGILTLLGCAAILMLPLSKLLDRCPPLLGLGGCAFLFLLTKQLPNQRIGLGPLPLFHLPDSLYQSRFLYGLGFPAQGFFSSDYFPLIPWFFLFLAGYFAWRCIRQNERLLGWCRQGIPIFSSLGRKSLLIYMVHQPILMALLVCLLGVP